MLPPAHYKKGLATFNDSQLADEIRFMHNRQLAAIEVLTERGWKVTRSHKGGSSKIYITREQTL